MKKQAQLLFMMIAIAALIVSPVWAQETTEEPSQVELQASYSPEVLILKKVEEELKAKYKNDIYVPPSIPSLMFTSSQQSLLREAGSGFKMSLLDETQDGTSASGSRRGTAVVPTGVRKLALGGIVFTTPDNWTIWLNQQRVTPSTLPPEAVDIRVYKEFIELKWFDSSTNQIYPVRLRPNQIFHLDGKIFVPG